MTPVHSYADITTWTEQIFCLGYGPDEPTVNEQHRDFDLQAAQKRPSRKVAASESLRRLVPSPLRVWFEGWPGRSFTARVERGLPNSHGISLRGVAEAAPYCAHRTSTVSSCEIGRAHV